MKNWTALLIYAIYESKNVLSNNYIPNPQRNVAKRRITDKENLAGAKLAKAAALVALMLRRRHCLRTD
ncbi:hypothetical protein [Desulfosporosinus sp. OT]|uniref:hypothetical protein n=1 Tax=Desulfosporosinus sp. OT TaxID=913865 RepID=UPI001A981CEA|nr:hypothetical protein [Desulfosporosinus sp. OT]